jgi:hypothetical protein
LPGDWKQASKVDHIIEQASYPLRNEQTNIGAASSTIEIVDYVRMLVPLAGSIKTRTEVLRRL